MEDLSLAKIQSLVNIFGNMVTFVCGMLLSTLCTEEMHTKHKNKIKLHLEIEGRIPSFFFQMFCSELCLARYFISGGEHILLLL